MTDEFVNLNPTDNDKSRPEAYTYPVQTAQQLLSTERRQQLLKMLPGLTQMLTKDYLNLYMSVIYAFAEFVQELPETKNGYFANTGGLLDHGLERAVRALTLGRVYINADENNTTKEAVTQRALLRYALFTAALLFDVGKVTTKINIVLCDAKGKPMQAWNPYEGSMLGQGTHYRYSFEAANWDYLRTMVTPVVARQLMVVEKDRDKNLHSSGTGGFNWLATDREILENWFAMLKEDSRQLTSIFTVIPMADAQTIANYFNLNFEGAAAAPTAGFWDKYNATVNVFNTEAKGQAMRSDAAKIAAAQTAWIKDQAAAHQDQQVEAVAQQDVQNKAIPLTDLPMENVRIIAASRKLSTMSPLQAAGQLFYNWLLRMTGQNIYGSTASGKPLVHNVAEGMLLSNKAYEQFAKNQAQIITQLTGKPPSETFSAQQIRGAFLQLLGATAATGAVTYGVTSGSGFTNSAKITGDVINRYALHPSGNLPKLEGNLQPVQMAQREHFSPQPPKPTPS